MTTPCFPTDVGLYWPYTAGPTFKTFVQPLSDGTVQVRTQWRSSGVNILTFITEGLTEARRQPVGDFLAALQGAATEYYLFLPDTAEVYKNANVGATRKDVVLTTGSAGQPITIPFRQSVLSSAVVYVDGVSKAFTYVAGFGPNGEDQITITGAQAASKPITIDVVGRLRLLGRGGDNDAVAALLEGYSPLLWQYTLHFRES